MNKLYIMDYIYRGEEIIVFSVYMCIVLKVLFCMKKIVCNYIIYKFILLDFVIDCVI